MKKIYKSGSILHISIILPNGASRHISFNDAANGTSSLITDDKDMQEGLESHHGFGTMFTCEDINESKEKEPTDVIVKTNIVEVSDLQEAQDYLIDKFNISRTKIRSEASVNKVAKSNGIEFKFL
jgi:hypothetical protein